jgi:GTP-binding protein YchF
VAEVGAAGRREIHVGQAKVPDQRLDQIYELFPRARKVNATVEYVDVVGFTSGDARKATFENQFLGDIRTCDAILQVLRGFEAPGMSPVNPTRDFREADQEFMLSDHIILEKRLNRLKKDFSKMPNKPEAQKEMDFLERCLESLGNEIPLRQLDLRPEEKTMLQAYQPLCLKPQLAVLNVGEADIRREDEIMAELRPQIEGTGVELAAACASLEMEISQLEVALARDFMDDLGIEMSALHRLLRVSYHLLGLISFFTIGDDECRAWTIPKGSTAKQAAGAVHSDMERGFIRADVAHFGDFITRGNWAACRAEGVMRVEGKEYIVEDGDIMEFRFAV